jgi:excisionase family DNA binding protein
MAAGWLLREGRLEGLPTREATLRSVIPDIVEVLPPARALRAATRLAARIDEERSRGGRSAEAATCTRSSSDGLAASVWQAPRVRSKDGRLAAMQRRSEEVPRWLTYAEAAHLTGWSVRHLRNLVSAGRIPVYGRPRVRRFRRDMLDLYLTNPDMAMRKFLSERNRMHGR